MDVHELLAEYERLHAAGLISDEEYQRQVERVRAYLRAAELERVGPGAFFRLEPGVLTRILTSQVFWVVLVLALMPLVLLAFDIPSNQGMTLYFAFLWFFLFLRLFRLNLRGSSTWDYSLVAALVVVPGLVGVLPLMRALLAPFYRLIDASFLPARWLGFVLGVGLTEELTKMLPVMVAVGLASRAGRRMSLQAAILLGICSGLAFAGFENILYTQWFGARIWGVPYARQDVVLSRLLMTPFLHSLWAGLTGFAMGASMLGRGPLGWRLLRFLLPFYLMAALLHGTYDTVAFSPVLAAAVGAGSYFVLVLVVVAAKTWEGESRRFLGERVV